MKTVAVIGGGPAGMMAALTAAKAGAKVTIYEKNEKLGKKLYITGKGRCNLTNSCPLPEFFDQIPRGRKFLYSAIYSFSNEDTCTFFKDAGLPLKEERGGRIFPVSDKSSDVIRALEKEVKKAGVRIRLKTEIKDLSELKEDSVIVATGGLSYPSTGSTGDGFRFAKELGHTVSDPVPSLCPILCSDSFIPELEGLSLRNIEVRILAGKKTVFRQFGEMLFTGNGVSGPVILTASSEIGRALNRKEKEYRLLIDLKPPLSEEVLDKRILRDFEEEKNKAFKNSLGKLLPSKMIPVVISLSGIDPFKKVNEITKKERAELVHLLKSFPLTPTGTAGFDQAVITSGGVALKEIDPKTMESKIKPGIFFAGEVLDADAYTGGFNLQIAFSTGRAAGEAAVKAQGKGKTMNQIAIDGPAGAGKSTIAKMLSKELGYVYIDTGAMYRTIGLYCIRNGADQEDEERVSALCKEAEVDVQYIDGVQHMFLNGEDVSEAIRTEEVSAAASAISKFKDVREKLVSMQQELAKKYDVVMDGRDIGTKVLPDATLKIYLTASVEVRAQRRYNEYLEKGMSCDFDAIKRDIEQRDHNDMTREISPLCKAEDAIEVDSSDMTKDEVVARIRELMG
ncbi:MAG: (d)CMP kinase [Parasporobacterium sp.]|nr:(d)CMP kinase [Parasporobacterium sp.]